MALTTTPIELSSTPSIVDGGNATAITIDSSENVIIGSGNSSITLSTWDSNKSDIAALTSSSDFGGLIEGGENGSLVLGIQDNDNTDAVYIISGSGNYMTDSTYDKVVLKAAASGAVTIAGTLTAGDGHTFGSDGDDNLLIASSANENIIIDSAVDIILDTDNNSIKFKDNGTQFGSLGASAGLFVAGTACGIRLHSGGGKIFPTDASGGANDDAVDLGAVGGAWKEVYAKRFITDGDGIKMASGMGIKFDAYGSGNVLDDYEEGTFTPSLTFGGNAVGISYVTQIGKYTKIGNTVHCQIRIKLDDKGTSTGIAQIALPFAASLSSNEYPTAFISHHNGPTSQLYGLINASGANSQRLDIGVFDGDASYTAATQTTIGDTIRMSISLTYKV